MTGRCQKILFFSFFEKDTIDNVFIVGTDTELMGPGAIFDNTETSLFVSFGIDYLEVIVVFNVVNLFSVRRRMGPARKDVLI